MRQKSASCTARVDTDRWPQMDNRNLGIHPLIAFPHLHVHIHRCPLKNRLVNGRAYTTHMPAFNGKCIQISLSPQTFAVFMSSFRYSHRAPISGLKVRGYGPRSPPSLGSYNMPQRHRRHTIFYLYRYCHCKKGRWWPYELYDNPISQ